MASALSPVRNSAAPSSPSTFACCTILFMPELFRMLSGGSLAVARHGFPEIARGGREVALVHLGGAQTVLRVGAVVPASILGLQFGGGIQRGCEAPQGIVEPKRAEIGIPEPDQAFRLQPLQCRIATRIFRSASSRIRIASG